MLITITSTLLLIAAFPNFNLNYIAFFAFVPLFCAIENKSPKNAFLISYVCGFLFYLGTLYWLYHVTIIGLIILCLYLALYFGVFGFLFSLCAFRYTLCAMPLIWVFLEYIQANIPIMGFGWLSLGYSQYKNLPLIQIADFSGVYGVSFVIMMVNVAVWSVTARLRIKCHCESQRDEAIFMRLLRFARNDKRGILLLAMITLLLIASYTYGFFRLSQKNSPEKAVRVSVIQGNIPQELKWDPEARDMIIEKYTALTKMASFDNPDLIVWPETSFPGFFEIDEDITDRVLNLAKDIKIPVLIGINREENGNYFNSAGLISSQGEFTDKYDKIHLVPFGEYVPFSNKFPVLHKLVLGELGEFTPGKDFKVFVKDCRDRPLQFGALICFEDIFPELSRKFIKSGAKFLIVITNDAWYGKSGAAYQHAACSVFRAIENHVPIIRCANTGYSSFIDSRGRIYDSVEEKGNHLFVTGYKTSEVNF